jgi:hypothetical protein
MTNKTFHEAAAGTKPWRVFVGYDNPQTHQRASDVCNLIAHKFWPEIEFELQPCELGLLSDADYQARAVASAAQASIIIIASATQEHSLWQLHGWLESVRANRHGREGVVIGLLDEEAPDELRDTLEFALRRFAHQAGLDYLNHAPHCLVMSAREETESLGPRETEVGGVMEEILAQPHNPVEETSLSR